ncbi:MAG TPA: amidohydrolase family protein [Smithella sp.]|nr:amidohydrolase family protein [Smithella sp.]
MNKPRVSSKSGKNADKHVAAKQLPAPIVDFHVHLFPDKLFDAIWRQFVAEYGWSILHPLYCRECVTYLREKGVGPIVYSNYAHRKDIAKRLNDWNLKILEELQDVYCFAAFHPDDKDGLSMAADLLDHPRILGFKLQLLVQRFSPDDERLFPLYEMVMAKRKRLLLHTGTGPVGNEFVGVAPFKRALARYPDLPAIVAHMGALEYGAFGALLSGHPLLYLDTAFSFLPDLGAMFNLGNEFLEAHRDRILYGSDFPNILFPREDEIDTLLELNLSQAFYDAVFRDNGLRLIHEISREMSR